MYLFISRLLSRLRHILPAVFVWVFFMTPESAHAAWGILDSFNLAPFVPTVLDALMAVASGGYEFFVGNGDGIIYILIWGFLAVSLSLYLVKLYLPKLWVSLFGFSGGGEMADGKATGMQISLNVLKPGLRAMIAAIVLLQIKPIYVTEWLVNPFLEFGAIYTQGIFAATQAGDLSTSDIHCPPDIIERGWISESSCDFLVKPVDIISQTNNRVIKRGLELITRGLRGLIVLVPHGGQDFMNLVTGIVLVTTFASCNLFMALLIIQAIFEFGMSLILYPFQVLTWVAKPKNPDKWFDIWPAFSGIVSALQKLVITMIACAFILCINIAVVKALFQWGNVVYVAAADGSSSSNLPQIGNATGFGQHSVVWLSAILTFYLMLRIFELTKKQLREYTSGTSDELYKSVTSDAQAAWKKAKAAPGKMKNAKEFAKDTYDVAAATGRATWNGMKWVGRTVRGWF